MSHEIRAPINAIFEVLRLLIKNTFTLKHRDVFDLGLTSSENLLQLTNDLLDITKIETGIIEIEETTFNVRLLFEDIFQSAPHQGVDENVELKLNCQLERDSLRSGSQRLRQVLLYLMSNAIKFTHHGKSLSARYTHAKSIDVKAA